MDVRMWDHPGIGRYVRELTAKLVPAADAKCFALLATPRFAEAFGPAPRHAEFRNAYSKIYGLDEQFEITGLSKDLDLLHVPHFNIPVFRKKPMVVTIHDLTYLREPGASKRRFARQYADFLFKKIVKKAAAVITVSEFTRGDLLATFPKLDSAKVFVTHEAASPLFGVIEDAELLAHVRTRLGLVKPFVLFVGSLKPHKNVPALIQAVDELRRRKGMDHELVLVGRPDPSNKALFSLIAQSPFVRALGEISDDDLVPLYNLADAFVLPSFREGFGLPALEAMACGAPVLVSDRSSLPEVVGEAGLVFDPRQVDALTELLYNVLRNRQLRENMKQSGRERAAQFSWERTAEETLRVYERVLS
jgi:glycosyltransferase involved in cell wall biosynthesis